MTPTVRLRTLGVAPSHFEIVRGAGLRLEPAPATAQPASPAWYPAGPWREVAGEIVAETSSADPDEITLLEFGEELVAHAHDEVIPLLTRANDARNEALSAAIGRLRDRLVEQLDKLGVHLDADGPSDVIVTPPGYASSSYNFVDQRYMGLHIDQHDDLPLDRRGEARRLCVANIGWADRWLNVYPYRLRDLAAATGLDLTGPGGARRSREIVQRYFANHPDASIVRVTLAPGQAYVFNTQDIPHDGATPEGTHPGVALHAMGSWSA